MIKVALVTMKNIYTHSEPQKVGGSRMVGAATPCSFCPRPIRMTMFPPSASTLTTFDVQGAKDELRRVEPYLCHSMKPQALKP